MHYNEALKGGWALRRDELKEEIECLRMELYRTAESSKSPTELLLISQKLDQLILRWMEMQRDELTQKKACNL